MVSFSRRGASGFSACNTTEDVTLGIDGYGLTAIITGSSNGIGAKTARVLAMHGVKIVMAVRNTTAGMAVKETILKETPSAKIEVLDLDDSSMASVRKFAEEFKSPGFPPNILINNAGVMALPYKLSLDKIELQFTMKKTASQSNIEGRIINVSSEAHKLAYKEGIRFDKLNKESGYSSWGAYGQSKLANILHANELSRRLKEDGVPITVNSLHPGAILTNLWRNSSIFGVWVSKVVVAPVIKIVGKNVPQNMFSFSISVFLTADICYLNHFSHMLLFVMFFYGASTTCYVAIHPNNKGVSGEYFVDNNIGKTTSQGRDT
ncbi:hypothetical protein MKW98_015869 [Papaver atlanticum]|uniref:Uncharacterized protein n=1 Tax=Papaver atlanticum TaxID=357466 RepID=A0AAD4XKD3_9MAGN|nr:hypothetical protein MKW98_015869 [Papaver atlanticum]